MKFTLRSIVVLAFSAFCISEASASKNLDYLVTTELIGETFSPSGENLAAIIQRPNGISALVVRDISESKSVVSNIVDVQAEFPEKNVKSFKWIGDDAIVLVSDWKDGADAIGVWSSGKRQVMPNRSAKRYQILDTIPETQEYLVAESPKWNAFGTSRVVKYRLNDSTKEVVFEVETKAFAAYCDRNHELKLVKKNKGKNGPVGWFAKSNGSADWSELALPSNVKFYGFDTESDVILVGGYLEKGAPGIYRYSLTKDQVVDTMIRNDQISVSDQGVPQYSKTLGGFIGLHLDLVKPRSVWNHDLFNKLQTKVDAIFKGSDNRIVSWSDDIAKIVVKRYFPDLPPQKVLVNLKNPKVEVLHVEGKNVKPAEAAFREILRIPTGNGYKMSCILARQKRIAKKTPLVILLRSEPWWTMDTAEWNAEEQFLAAEGYAVLRINMRGSGSHLGNGWSAWKSERDMQSAIDDLDNAISWISENKENVDTNRIAIIGTGGGAWLASYASTALDVPVKAVVSNTGVYDLVEYRNEAKIRTAGEIPFAKGNRMSDDQLASSSPASDLKNIKSALFVAYAIGNPGEYQIHVNTFYKSAKKAGVNIKKPYVGNWWGTRITKDSDLQKYYKEVSRFLAKEL